LLFVTTLSDATSLFNTKKTQRRIVTETRYYSLVGRLQSFKVSEYRTIELLS